MLGDLFSSSKGPGLIGLLLGLFVLAGFCGLGFAVFDGRLNGEIASRKKKELNQDAQKILLLKDQIVRSEGRMAGRKKRKEDARKLGVTKRGIDLRKIRLAEITSEVDGENGKITALKEEKKVYLQHYRKVAADRMVGSVFTKLTTLDGKIYYNVEITKVSGLEMSFKHKNGVGNVKLAVLEDALQDTLQFSVEAAEEIQDKIDDDEKVIAGMAALVGKYNRNLGDRRSHMDNIRRTQLKIDRNDLQKVKNKKDASNLKAGAKAEWAVFAAAKAAGQTGGSRADDRAKEMERRADAKFRANRGLVAENSTLREEVRDYERKIAKIDRDNEALKEDMKQLRIEHDKKAKEVGGKPTTEAGK